MKKNTLMKITGGVTVMTSVFLLLIIVDQLNSVNNLSTTIFNPATLTTPPPMPTSTITPTTIADKLVEGAFNPDTPGNVIYHDEENDKLAFHYKAIRSERFKDKAVKPKLQLEVAADSTKDWKDIEWSWIDYDQGILFFYYLKEDNGKKLPIDNYTGNYRVAFE